MNTNQFFSYAILMYLYGMDQIWKTAKRFYQWNEVRLQIWLQANRVARHFSLYRPTK